MYIPFISVVFLALMALAFPIWMTIFPKMEGKKDDLLKAIDQKLSIVWMILLIPMTALSVFVLLTEYTFSLGEVRIDLYVTYIYSYITTIVKVLLHVLYWYGIITPLLTIYVVIISFHNRKKGAYLKSVVGHLLPLASLLLLLFFATMR